MPSQPTAGGIGAAAGRRVTVAKDRKAGASGAQPARRRPMTPFEKPRWARRMDAINLTVIGVIMILIVWETLRRVFGF